MTKGILDCTIVGSDISEAALRVARHNAVRNRVSGSISFLLSDLFERIDGEYDIIVSNPPYIARHDFSGLQKEVLMEPHAALDGGEDGLDYYRRIFKEAKPHLTKGGYVIAEIGYGQLSDIRNIVRSSGGFDLKEIRKDQNGIDRVIITQWTS